jgi:hypothetical protein
MSNEQELKDLRHLFGLVCRASLATSRPLFMDDWEQQRNFSLLLMKHADHNAQELITHSHEVMGYLTFPLLEAVAKNACGVHLTLDGVVKKPFPRFDGSGNPVGQYGVGARCSSLRDLLWLLMTQIAGPELRAGLLSMRKQIDLLNSGTDSFDLLYRWRNSSLHGHKRWPTIGGTVFGLALLIALDDIRQGHDALKNRVMQRVRPRAASGMWSQVSYYPPHRDMNIPL